MVADPGNYTTSPSRLSAADRLKRTEAKAEAVRHQLQLEARQQQQAWEAWCKEEEAEEERRRQEFDKERRLRRVARLRKAELLSLQLQRDIAAAMEDVTHVDKQPNTPSAPVSASMDKELEDVDANDKDDDSVEKGVEVGKLETTLKDDNVVGVSSNEDAVSVGGSVVAINIVDYSKGSATRREVSDKPTNSPACKANDPSNTHANSLGSDSPCSPAKSQSSPSNSLLVDDNSPVHWLRSVLASIGSTVHSTERHESESATEIFTRVRNKQLDSTVVKWWPPDDLACEEVVSYSDNEVPEGQNHDRGLPSLEAARSQH